MPGWLAGHTECGMDSNSHVPSQLGFLVQGTISHLHKGGHEYTEHLPDSKSKQCAVTGPQRRGKKSLVSSNSVRVKGGYSN